MVIKASLTPMIILDTSYIISDLVEDDPLHSISKEKTLNYITNGDICLVNNLVISELVTLANNKFKKHKSYIFNYIDDLIASKIPQIIFNFIEEESFADILDLSKQYQLSFVDCSVIILALSYKKSEVLSHDKKLIKTFEELMQKRDEGKFLVNDKNKKKYKSSKDLDAS